MDNNLTTQINKIFNDKGLILSTAESCTGGLLSASITEISGASVFFNQGYITYSNEAKSTLLNVNPKTIQQFGAVSSQTATEMVKGLLPKCDIGCAITGVAGPTSSEKKPLGLVYIAVATNKDTICKEFHFSGNRKEIRKQSVISALKIILQATEFFN